MNWAERLTVEYARVHTHPFNIACHLVGIPVITTGCFLILLWVHPLAGLVCIAGGFAFNFAGHHREGSVPAFATRAWYSPLAGPFWWGRQIFTLARTGRPWSPPAPQAAPPRERHTA